MSVDPASESSFVFGEFRLIPNKQLLLHGTRRIKLGGRALDLLHLLVMRAGEEVTKGELIAFAWPKVFVDDQNLKVNINGLRRALHDTFPNPTYIATIVGRGYRFIATVRSEITDTIDFHPDDASTTYSLPSSSFLVGRDQDVARSAEAIERGRLVTFVGPGGVGKTSLAIAVAHLKANGFSGGVRFVDLSATEDAAFVAHMVATSLGVRVCDFDAMDGLAKDTAGSHRLLVLDNCEHVRSATAAIVDRILTSGGRISILATCREPLGAEFEEVLKIEPLPFPESQVEAEPAALKEFPSVQLFIQRALFTADYRVLESDLATVAGLCEALDGLPLAIELAAAALDNLSPAELLGSLKKPLKAPSIPSEGIQSRHQTLWNVLHWSYHLLLNNEAALFRVLSTFAGYFELGDVVGMARVVKLDPFQTNIALAGLVAKCLVTAEVEGELPRYRMLETARRFAAHQLRNTADGPAADRQHAEILLATLTRSEVEWPWIEHRLWHAKYNIRMGDLRRALDWSFGETGDARLGVELASLSIRLWNEQSSIFEQLHQVERALQHEASDAVEYSRRSALATARAWSMTLSRRAHTDTEAAWVSALHFSAASEEIQTKLAARFGFVVFLVYIGRSEDAFDFLVEARRIASTAGDRESFLDVQRLTAFVEMHVSGLKGQRAHLERLSDELRRSTSTSKSSRYKEQRFIGIHTTLSFVTYMSGDEDKALEMIAGMIRATSDSRQLMGQCHVLALFALPMSLLSRRLTLLDSYVGLLRHNLDQEHIALWEPVYVFFESYVRHRRGSVQGADDMRAAINDLLHDSYFVRTPMYLGVLASAFIESNRTEDATESLRRAFEIAQNTKELWFFPELLRIKAVLHHSLGDTEGARLLLKEAGAHAAEFGAVAFKARVEESIASIDGQEVVR